jgi:hypothetical protein
VPVTNSARALVRAWATGLTIVAGEAIKGAGGELYISLAGGTTASSGTGPSGTTPAADNSVTWVYAAKNASDFRNSMLIAVLTGSAASAFYSGISGLASIGKEIIVAGASEVVEYWDPTGIFVYSASTATLLVAAYP